MVMGNIILLFVIDGIMSGKALAFIKENGPGMRYIFLRWDDTAKIPETIAKKNVAIFYILLNTILPLAIVVVLEVAKQFYTRFVEYDVDMTMPDYETKELLKCSVNNS
jgi:hypothetical protein